MFFLWILGPTAKWLWPSYWWGTSVIVLMNENEARPCGGFVTAYGVLKLPLGGAELKNSFAFPPHNLGENTEPLRQVSVERKWWDLADTMNPKDCASQFRQAYEQVTGEEADRVILVQAELVETWLQALGGIKLGSERLTAQNFFAYTSRLVANVDRHDEQTLLDRKSPLGAIGKRLVNKTIFQPWRWPRVTRALGEAETKGQLYWHSGAEDAPAWSRQPDKLIAITEWNLGGGKSSRYLDKHWTIKLEQRTADLWDGTITLQVDHLGDVDLPLSQIWRGGFELFVLGQAPSFVAAEINPGESFSYQHKFRVSTAALFSAGQADLRLYAPPSQNWNTSFQLRALGQQRILKRHSDLNLKDNTATWHGPLCVAGQAISFGLGKDETAPFLVWHKPLAALAVPAGTQLDLEHQGDDTIVEVQFNEPVKLDWPSTRGGDGSQIIVDTSAVTLTDRNYEVPDYTEQPVVSRAVLLPDQRTLLLNLRQQQYQTNERFYLSLVGVADGWGNRTNISERTVITR